MNYVQLAAAVLAGVAIGGALVLWLKSRKTSTKAELMHALAMEAKLLAKMPGAADAVSLAQEQVQVEAFAKQKLQEALGVASQS